MAEVAGIESIAWRAGAASAMGLVRSGFAANVSHAQSGSGEQQTPTMSCRSLHGVAADGAEVAAIVHGDADADLPSLVDGQPHRLGPIMIPSRRSASITARAHARDPRAGRTSSPAQ